MLALSATPLKYAWMTQSKYTDDEGGTEVASFLHLIGKGSHHIEMLFADFDPEWEAPSGGLAEEVQRVGRLMLSRKALADGTIGYAMNSFRKIDSDHAKWRRGMLRVLGQAYTLITTGTLPSLEVPATGWGAIVRETPDMTDGEACAHAKRLEADIREAMPDSPLPVEPQLEAVNDWLLALRRERL